MKFTIKVMHGAALVFSGELTPGECEDRYGIHHTTLDDDSLRHAAFAIEKAINQETEFRCHVEEQA